ncbi:DUF6531 domain-containing protein [Streptomyces sp. H27-H1]|uniref:DUF6531 domain-containing protein n=1 Tax=Streptomyces sp. H27-H1 TaxID=2996461 RepID=UPI002270B478|nr:DUF6531 domain-containing protein [Streptomyces sp. H27-H1]MCY0928744.1 DUF6531 domain-containing protein [Streptomyces sp. H27-H1]
MTSRCPSRTRSPKVGSAASHLDDLKGPGRRHTDKDGPEGPARCTENKICAKDPVDVATGRMIMPQVDLVLPGSLSLVFERTFESSYRAGRWFGPAWASTIDQRLEIDAEGVVFIRDDSSVLLYPHPAPGVPVLPTHGQRWPLSRDPDGCGYTVSDPESGHVRHFGVREEGPALLDQIDDRNGRFLTFRYDDQGTPLGVSHSSGHQLLLTTADGRVTALRLTDGNEVMRFGYTDGHLTESTNSSGMPFRLAYDEHGRIVSWTDSNGSHFDYAYDDRDRCVAQSGAHGHLGSRFTYGRDPRTEQATTTVTDSAGHSHTYLVNNRSQVIAETDAMGAVTRYEFDRFNRLLSHTDPLGHQTRSTYDEDGRLVSLIRPDGREATAEYDGRGRLVRVSQPDSTVIRQTYDACGNRTSLTDSSGATTHFTYDALGHLASVTDPFGHTTAVRCDVAGLPAEITDPLGATTRYTRDAFGRPATVVDPLGNTTRFTWSVEGRLLYQREPDGTEQSWAYDGEGNCIRHVGATGAVESYEYGAFDLLMARTGADGARHDFTHDHELRLTQVTGPHGLTWSYAYDPAGRLVEETDFDGRGLLYSYDPAGRLVTRTNALGQRIAYERDELGRIVRKDAAGAVTTFEYDIFGRLAHAIGPDGTLTRLRDKAGRVRSENVDGREIAYAYDKVGRRVARTTPTGSQSSWSHDAAGRRTGVSVAGRNVGFRYDEAGRELERLIGGAVTLSSQWDELGRVTARTVTGGDGRLVQRRSYAYRSDGHLIGVEDHLAGARRFDLDPVGRVTAVHADAWTEEYAYDAAGNQVSASWPPSHPGGEEATGARCYEGTRLVRAGRVRYEYDALGRVTLRQKPRLSRKPDTWRYTWDAEDRLTAVTTPDGVLWRYTYDPLGRRTSKRSFSSEGTALGEEALFTWDGSVLCEQSTRSAGSDSVILTWEHEGLHPLSQLERIRNAAQEDVNERFFAIVTDLIGTPTELIDEQGEIAWRTSSTLWGTTSWNRDASAYTPLRFPGQYFDPETGLHYNYFRYYDPETARYVTQDPLGLAPAPNPSTYVANPHTWFDPLGLYDCAKVNKVIDQALERAVDGKRRTATGYHGHLTPERELEIISNPDGIYISKGGQERLIFHQGEDIMIMESKKGGAGNVVTSYGPSGPKNDSGAAAWGGSPDDPGPPVTRDMIVEGRIPKSKGDGFLPPAEQLR